MKKLFSLFLCLILGCITISSYANSISISPTQVYLSAEQPINILTLSNPNDTSILMQLEIMHWTQQNGKDIFLPTDDILATPPIFELPPHQTQIVRFAIQRASNVTIEQTYRVYLKEVTPPVENFNIHGNSQLQIMLNISLPLFISPEKINKSFVWSAKRLNTKQIELELKNTGNVTLFTNQFSLFTQKFDFLKKQTMFNYILPSQQQRWIVSLRKVVTPINIVATINGQQIISRVQMA